MDHPSFWARRRLEREARPVSWDRPQVATGLFLACAVSSGSWSENPGGRIPSLKHSCAQRWTKPLEVLPGPYCLYYNLEIGDTQQAGFVVEDGEVGAQKMKGGLRQCFGGSNSVADLFKIVNKPPQHLPSRMWERPSDSLEAG